MDEPRCRHCWLLLSVWEILACFESALPSLLADYVAEDVDSSRSGAFQGSAEPYKWLSPRYIRLLEQFGRVVVHFCFHKLGIAEIVVQTRVLYELEALLIDFDLLRSLSDIKYVYVMRIMFSPIVASGTWIEDLGSAFLRGEIVVESSAESIWR